MPLTLLSAEDLRRSLSMVDAIEAMKAAFAALSTDRAHVPVRTQLPVPAHDAVTLVMPAHLTAGGLGAKIVSVFPRNSHRGKPTIHGLVVVLDPETGEPSALVDGTFLTAWRTGAASGAATDLLALQDAQVAALIGCGAQAVTQAVAIDTVRELEEIRVVGRSLGSAERFVRDVESSVRARLVPMEDPSRAIDGAEIVCTATDSHTPVFDGRWLAQGAHINGVGSYTTEMQEVDSTTVRRARIFVDQREAALSEAGDLVIAAHGGHTRPEAWTELGEVVAGLSLGRRNASEITFFKSVGNAVQDIAAASRALERARELGLGQTVDF